MDLYQLFTQCLQVPYLQTGVSANYAVKREKDTLYIFFESSNGQNDWKRNLDFPLKAYKRMEKTVWFAHRGFLKTWKEIEPLIANDIADTHFQKIVVAGFSHGAAIAALCHEYVWFHRPDIRDNIEGYGFGSPRVFWGIKSAELKRRWARFTVIRNIDDIVTHLPPAAFGYTHVGTLLKIGKRGNYTRIQAHYPENIQKELLIYEKNRNTV